MIFLHLSTLEFSMDVSFILLYYIAIYLFGAVPYSIIVSKIKGVNLLEIGSGNAGATNVYRALGLKYAILVFFLDLIKGFLACLLTGTILHTPLHIVLAGTMAILGHTFSPFLHFRGGKGAATGLGVLLYINPVLMVALVLTASIVILATRIVSLASMICAIMVIFMYNVEPLHGPVTCFAAYPVHPAIPYRIFFTFIGFFIIFKHKENIKRLLKGQEKRI